MGRNFVIFDFYLSLPYQSFDMENISEIKEFNKLFSNYQGIFIRFANTYIQDEDTAEDIVVDSLVYYWENILSPPIRISRLISWKSSNIKASTIYVTNESGKISNKIYGPTWTESGD